MGTYWYLDPKGDGSRQPVFEDEYVAALLTLLKKNQVEVNDKIILAEVENLRRKNRLKPTKLI